MNRTFLFLLILCSLFSYPIGSIDTGDHLWLIEDQQEPTPSPTPDAKKPSPGQPSPQRFFPIQDEEETDVEPPLQEEEEQQPSFEELFPDGFAPQKQPPAPPQEQEETTPAEWAPAKELQELKPTPAEEQLTTAEELLDQNVSINFTNINAVELLRYISQVTNKNFIFDANDLQFTVTIISEEETSIANIMIALIQELRIHGLSIIEKDGNFVIHQNPEVNSISRVSSEALPGAGPETEIVTQVFRLRTLDPVKAVNVIRPLVSDNAIVDALENSNHLIITDIVSSVELVADLLKSMDSPQNGIVVGQYVATNTFIDTLVQLTQQIMEPLSQTQPVTLVPHYTSNSIFIVSTRFLVEKTISVMQHIDQTEGITRMYNLDDLKIRDIKAPSFLERKRGGRWELDKGRWVFQSTGEPTDGEWMIDDDGNWYFVPKGEKPPSSARATDIERPKGQWQQAPDGGWVFQLFPGESISAVPLTRPARIEPDLPLGHFERTKFFIHKLQYRKGDYLQQALSNIGYSLEQNGTSNEDLITTINSVQWIKTSNSLVFAGTESAIDKVKNLIEELDVPLRQVFIEMLIIETTLDDSLDYSVNPGARFGGGSEAGAEIFRSGASTLPASLDTAGVRDGALLLPDAFTIARNSSISQSQGFQLGIVGQAIKCGGTTFNTLGALVNALHQKDQVDIIMTPKIIAEDGVPAEVFVGINTRFQEQSVSNDEGSVITTNFEFRDVGTLLQVTPFLGNGDIVSMEIYQEVSRAVPGTGATQDLSSSDPGPTTTQNRTTTRVHVPDGYFLVLSGMIEDDKAQSRNQVPCLGGVPILGAAFSEKRQIDVKRNTMVFIRPRIIDTVEQIQNLTKHQQDIWDHKHRKKKMWLYETDEALDFFNINPKDETSFGNREFY